ncbi:LysR family transcriptional regulator [Paenibacillus alvei]|uniref:LysR family transcriptional regulator n=1 Tax=Paenibacillus alvei TaxID=44250 RepID=UPI0018CD8CAE|nr:LysR family transcriptional regulator [Paenibacillus alvei]MBG9735640.1 LysR family transcriptional regulator [Paenibacillus alvei]MBG9746630.1 LysR family transcriptional regulator [Paenibacillus alvei]MCY9578396.1 LysR family transcriptional regulator [Paenibacillus alvei]MCY9584717.1 LysR family transcriptional regulator [Paenibacillus alvei]
MTIARYEVFMKVVEQGNFTKAAEQLNMTQSAVSHAIASLEKEIGYALLNRSKQAKISTTVLADRLIPHMMQILRSEAIIREEISVENHQLEGTLKIGAFTSAASQLLPPMIAQLKTNHPRVKVVLFEGTYDEILTWLTNGTVDIGFIMNTEEKGHLHKILIHEDELVVGMPHNHPFAQLEVLDIKQLEGIDFIIPRASYQRQVLACLTDHNVTPNVLMEVLHCDTIINMASQGIGVTIGPKLLFQSYEQMLHKPLIQDTSRPICLAYRIGSPTIEAFLVSNQLEC